MTFSVQPIEEAGKVSGYVVSGFVNQKQLMALRELVDSDEYQTSRKWRGQYQEMAKAIVSAVDGAIPAKRRSPGPK